MSSVFRRIEATKYRCLKSVSQALKPLDILVGVNASGKSTFLDVVAFLVDFVRNGLESAVTARTANFHDLVWGREGPGFVLAIEASVPKDEHQAKALPSGVDTIRYELGIGLDTESEIFGVTFESVELLGGPKPKEIIRRKGPQAQFWTEVPPGQSYERDTQHKNYSSLTRIPADTDFPAAAWLRELLRENVQKVVLDTRDLQRPSPPGRGDTKTITGLTLARSVAQLSQNYPATRFQDWIAHVQTALPDIRTIRTVLKEEDKHRYLMVQYENGIEVPSWILSEGTLRLLALTILAYLPDFRGVYLVEEPENGVHPAALETIYQSLSSIYDAQVFVATHSPILLNMASPDQILVFSKTPEGAQIVRGSQHPALQNWQKEVSLGTLAASGILG
jgi:predicted ATPase